MEPWAGTRESIKQEQQGHTWGGGVRESRGRALEEEKRGKGGAQIAPGTGACKTSPTMVGGVESEPGRPFGASYLP